MNFTDEELAILKDALDAYWSYTDVDSESEKMVDRLSDTIQQEIKDRQFEKTKEL